MIMSLWDGLKSIGSAVVESVKARQERIEHYKEIYDRLDDEALLRKYRASSGEAKYACAILLKERGYGNQDE